MAEPETPELARAAVDGGADIIELGFPFSDPLADGPVIRRAGERALARGMRTKQCLEVLARTRELVGPDLPLIPMTYSSLFEAHGWDVLTREIHEHGGTSMIVADLPAGERAGLKRVQMVAPTSTDDRIELAGQQTDGWLYLVTLTGTTGARADVSPSPGGAGGRGARPAGPPPLGGLGERARRLVQVPLYAGFGISTPEHARAAAQLADGIAVGTRAVEVAEDGPAGWRQSVASLRAALDDSGRAGAGT